MTETRTITDNKKLMKAESPHQYLGVMEMIAFVCMKTGISELLARRIIQDVCYFVAIGLAADRHVVYLPDLGHFKLDRETLKVTFTPSNSTMEVLQIAKNVNSVDCSLEGSRETKLKVRDRLEFVTKISDIIESNR